MEFVIHAHMDSCLGYMCVCVQPWQQWQTFWPQSNLMQRTTRHHSAYEYFGAIYIAFSKCDSVCMYVCVCVLLSVHVCVCVCWLLFDFGWLPVGLNVAAFLVTWPFVGLTLCAHFVCVRVCVCASVCVFALSVGLFVGLTPKNSAQLSSTQTQLFCRSTWPMSRRHLLQINRDSKWM